MRVTDTYYELHLRPDLYTDRHCQWFYFRVQNMKAGIEYRFSQTFIFPWNILDVKINCMTSTILCCSWLQFGLMRLCVGAVHCSETG